MRHTRRVTAPDPLLDRPSWAPPWLPGIDDERAMRLLQWAIGAVLAVGALAFITRGADGPADPVLGAPLSVAPLAEAFGTIAAEIASSSGEVLRLCLLHADQPEERGRGLKGVLDLQGYDGMLLANDAPVESELAMIDAVRPLSASWWAADGTFVSAAELAPCTAVDTSRCRRYAAAGPYRWAVLLPRGEQTATGAAPGASLRLGAEACPAG